MVLHEPPRKLGGAVYVLPNLITTGNLFFGFFSIVKSLQFNFEWAASAILLAAVFDVLDGRVARLTGGSSEFGVQYDSLCDLVSFGLAPAFLMYQFGLSAMGRIGWVICFLFLACGALRLARFNVQSSIGKADDDFTGLPIPMAAGVIACFVAASVDLRKQLIEGQVQVLKAIAQIVSDPSFSVLAMSLLGPTLAIAMVSNIAYRSHKAIKLRYFSPFNILVLAVLVLAVVAYQPELFGFILFASYAFSGMFEWIFGWKKAVADDDIFTPLKDHESVLDSSRHQFNWHDGVESDDLKKNSTSAISKNETQSKKAAATSAQTTTDQRRKDQGFF